jgi:hypothetical protein
MLAARVENGQARDASGKSCGSAKNDVRETLRGLAHDLQQERAADDREADRMQSLHPQPEGSRSRRLEFRKAVSSQISLSIARAAYRLSCSMAAFSERLQGLALNLNISTAHQKYARWKRNRMGRLYRKRDHSKPDRPRAFKNRGDGHDLDRVKDAIKVRDAKKARRAQRALGASRDNQQEK